MNKDLKQFYSDTQDQFVLSEQASKRVKENIFAKLGSVEEAAEPFSALDKLRNLFLNSYILVPLVVLLFISGTAYASAASLPGDTLYPVKRAVESAQITLAPTQAAKVNLEEQFAQKRLDELEALPKDHPQQAQDQPQDTQQSDINEKANSPAESDAKVEEDNTSENHSGNKARQKAQQEVRKAIENLKSSQNKLEQNGNQDRANQIQDKLRVFNRRLNNDDNEGGHDRSGNNDRRDQSNFEGLLRY